MPRSRGAEEIRRDISRLERWLSAIASHRPGALDDDVRSNYTGPGGTSADPGDAATVVSLIREPGASIFFVNEPRPARTR